MHDYLKPESSDEIDLRELFITIWAYKLFIACACALGIVFGGYYALNADKEYTSAAIFKIDQSKSGGISLGGELGALASLAGFGGASAASILPTDQVTGRIFIENLDAKLNFQHTHTQTHTHTHTHTHTLTPVVSAAVQAQLPERPGGAKPIRFFRRADLE